MFWKFANDAAETQDGERRTHIAGRGCSSRVAIPCSTPPRLTDTRPRPMPIRRLSNGSNPPSSSSQRINARVVHQGNRAFYSPADDTITLPPFAAFFTPMDYYSTRAHETGHWTSSEGRCNRELGKRFGDNAYSVEELVAELTAAFTLAHLGLSSEPRPDHAQYIASWLKVLKADKRAIFTAASKAQQAADFMIQHSRQWRRWQHDAASQLGCDRFDLYGALYLFCSRYHSGQWSSRVSHSLAAGSSWLSP